MGKSNSIQKQQQENQAFNEYVEKMRIDLDAKLEKERKAMDENIKQRYLKYGDDNSLISSTYQHLTTVDEWSLQSVNNVISQCRTAIFGGKLPSGAKQDAPKADVTTAIKAMANLDLLIANAAFDAVQSLLSSVGSSTETNITVKSDIRPLAPGLTLFITVAENSFHRKDFFTDKTIVQNLFIFDARFSIKEGQAVSHLSDLQAYENQKQSFRTQLQKVDSSVEALDPVADDYLDRLAKFNAISDTLNERLDLIDQKLQAMRFSSDQNSVHAMAHTPAGLLGSSELAAHASERWAIVSRIRSRFEAALVARDAMVAAQ